MLARNLHQVAFSKGQLVSEMLEKFGVKRQKLVIDFSSPNISKTFHMGNLRSTLYGNFLQKICRLAGHDVVSINYLGDWGPQFSMLAFYWMAVMDGKEGRKKRPEPSEWTEMGTQERVEILTSAYTSAHRMSKLNSAFAEKARQLYLGMENARINHGFEQASDASTSSISSEVFEAFRLLHEWRGTSITYLEKLYDRFGVHFDEWDGESFQVARGAKLVNEILTSEKYNTFSNDDHSGVFSADSGRIALRRADGAGMYMTRELASVYSRHERHNADQYIYVVDKAQANHFSHLKALLKMRGDEELANKILHHSYGRVIGLSTREGKNDSVEYLIAEGSAESEAYVANSHTRRSSEEEKLPLCRALAHSQLAFDLVRRARHSDFTFSYKGAFLPEGTNALILQQKYSRLNSLEKANEEHVCRVKQLDDNSLMRMQMEIGENGRKLARMILEFDTVLNNSLQRMEPSPIANHLVRLTNLIGKAMPALRVLGEPLANALPRMLLFSASKRVLGEGMNLIGIKPIERI